ncbi:hypothetical protein RDV89_11790 [Nocardioides zeae]|uniref:Uncharacterized protein n=1 Tax=Nocardioides imazamoxiresistens TaxID=3231893 RepID=A0ABU3PWY9_9ACTN|nr:hypothetical protein [Nocardioides zeae]MDT9593753.1 hypothetical protein [Nocardioides zeae]
MEVLLWLVPPVAVTVVAMAWVGWAGRDRPAPDRHEQVRRIGEVLSTPPTTGYAAPRRDRGDRSSGVAVRRPGAD